MSKKKTGKQYEKLVYKIYAQLSINCEVKIDDKIMGRSGVARQVDVSVRYKIAGLHDHLMIINAKDYSEPSGINDVSVMADTVDDLQAQKGVLICNKGFTSGAKKRAKEKSIDLLSAHSAENKDWQKELKIPLIWENIDFAPIRFHFQGSSAINRNTGEDRGDFLLLNKNFIFYKLLLVPNEHIETKKNSTILKDILELYNTQPKLREEGKHSIALPDFDCFYNEFYIRILNLKIDFTLSKKYYFKEVVPEYYTGILDIESNAFKYSEIIVSGEIPQFHDVSWTLIENSNEFVINSTKLNILGITILGTRFLQLKYENL